MGVSEGEALQWMALIPKFQISSSYKSYLKMACARLKGFFAWNAPLVKAEVSAKLKKPGGRKSVKWACAKELLEW